MDSLFKYLHHKCSTNTNKWYPIVAVYYLTYNCNFCCKYCSDGEGKPYYLSKNNELDAENVIKVLQQIRRYSKKLVLTGGEPLEFEDLSLVLNGIQDIGFNEVIFTTNGYNLEQHIEQISQTVTTLVISINSMSPEKSAQLNGIDAFSKVMANIDLAKQTMPSNSQVIISSVVTPDNIKDLYEVVKYCSANNFTFAAQPQLIGVRPNQLLLNNSQYRKFYDYLIKKKKSGSAIYGSIKYLQYMRNLQKFKCYPFTMLVVAPDGQVYYPCLEIGHKAGNILDETNLHKLRQQAEIKFGPQPECNNQCQSACALGFSTMIDYPASLSSDILYTLKGQVKRAIGLQI